MSILRFILILFTSVFLVFITVYVGRFPIAIPSPESQLRINFRLQPQVHEECRLFTKEEIQNTPVHMRQERKCERTNIPYDFSVFINGEEYIQKKIIPTGMRADQPIFIFEEFNFLPGEYDVHIKFTPDLSQFPESTKVMQLELQSKVILKSKKVSLVYLNNLTGALELSH